LLSGNQHHGLRLNRTDIFATSAAITELRVDPDPYSRIELDSPWLAAFYTGATFVAAGQATVIKGLCHQIDPRLGKRCNPVRLRQH
jgi:hypothetical protein